MSTLNPPLLNEIQHRRVNALGIRQVHLRRGTFFNFVDALQIFTATQFGAQFAEQ